MGDRLPWRLVAWLLRLPDEPPALPAEELRDVEQFRPAPGYRRYLLASNWLTAGPIGVALLTACAVLAVLSIEPVAAILLLVLGTATFVLGLVFHLGAAVRYRMTWFALGSRSVRMRRGAWKITEATITYENVQNVKVQQGPLQRLFGISSVEIETAGGGSRARSASSAPWLQVLMVVLQGVLAFLPGGAAVGGATGGVGSRKRPGEAPGKMEGLGDPARVRERIMARVRRSRMAGLGDEISPERSGRRITAEHLAAMEEIRNALRSPGSSPGDPRPEPLPEPPT